MAHSIKWTKTAKRQLDILIEFLLEEANEQAISKLLADIEHKLSMIAAFPEVGRPSSKVPEVRLVNINKHLQLFYSITPTNISVLNLFDTRQSPDKRPY